VNRPRPAGATTSPVTTAETTLDRARAAYAAGDLAQAAELAHGLASAEDPELRRQAAELERSIRPDPVEVAVIVACLLGLMAITWHYLL
jgi:hypothetical protein